MPKSEELLRLVKEASNRIARIQPLAASIGTTPEYPLDDYSADLLSAYLEIVIDNFGNAED